MHQSQILGCFLIVALAVSQANVVRTDETKPEDPEEAPETKTLSREKRTLGLLTVGAQAVSKGVGTVGKLAAAGLATAVAAKPLIILGLGKCKYLSIPSI